MNKVQIIQTAKCYAQPMRNLVRFRVVLKANKYVVQVYDARAKGYMSLPRGSSYRDRIDALMRMRREIDTLQSYSPS